MSKSVHPTLHVSVEGLLRLIDFKVKAKRHFILFLGNAIGQRIIGSLLILIVKVDSIELILRRWHHSKIKKVFFLLLSVNFWLNNWWWHNGFQWFWLLLLFNLVM